MKYILIYFVVWGTAGTGTGSVEFDSKLACERAADEITHNWDGYALRAKAFCAKKGE